MASRGRRTGLGRCFRFVNTLPRIERLLATMEPPAIAKVYRPSPKELVFEGKPGSVKQVDLPFGY